MNDRQRLLKQFPTYIRFVFAQHYAKKWQHLSIILFPVMFYILLISLKYLLMWMSEEPIPIGFADQALSLFPSAFMPGKNQKQYLSYKQDDNTWPLDTLNSIWPNIHSYQKLDAFQYLEAASVTIGSKSAVIGPIQLQDFSTLKATIFYKQIPVVTQEGKLVTDGTFPHVLGVFYDQWQKSQKAAGNITHELSLATLGWIDIPDVPFITTNLVNDGAYLIFVFINHILLPLCTVDMVTQKTSGFMNLVYVSGLKQTVFYTANFVFYYCFALVMSLINFGFACAFGLSIKEKVGEVMVLSIFFPFFELPLSFLFAQIFTSTFTASMVMWFSVVLIPQLLVLVANAVLFKENFVAWFLPSAAIVYINNQNPAIQEQMTSIIITISVQCILIFVVAVFLVTFFNYGKQVIRKMKQKNVIEFDQEVAQHQEMIDETEQSIAPIQISGITMAFGSKSNPFYALDKVNIVVNKNEIKGLIGHNGSGKTTLMNVITGGLKQTSGQFKISGFVCYCPQFDSLPNDFVVKDIIKMFSDLRARDGNIDAMSADTLIDLLDVRDCLNKKIKTVSYGDRRKIQLISATVNTLPSDIVLLDEVTTNLSRNDVVGVWKILQHLKSSNSSVLFISHDLDEVETLCDRIVMLKKGKVVLDADPKAIIQDNEYDSVEIFEPISSMGSLSLFGIEKVGVTGNFNHYIIKQKIESINKNILEFCDENHCIIKSADLQTVFEAVEGLV
ncbi:ABC transporter, ATP-binding protein [Spironucleus salmonicida]|uniref:ABC transporter family protein n=1 Tax=Spironucleus salmonicida TaxID=348837 RepID=V6LSC3_9EUKA|nr:ABC transporter, ATP-binding protein [Spironucleus salmonicida]|eukprot:EST47490.1 ABC transporter family protein [Spironucleus salmonicida]